MRGLSSRPRRRCCGGAPRHSPFVPVFAPLCLTLSLASRLVSIPFASAVARPLQRALGEFFWCGFGAIVRSGAWTSGYEVRAVLVRLRLRLRLLGVRSSSQGAAGSEVRLRHSFLRCRSFGVWCLASGFVVSVGVFVRSSCFRGVSKRVPGFGATQVWLAVHSSRLVRWLERWLLEQTVPTVAAVVGVYAAGGRPRVQGDVLLVRCD